MEFPLARFAWQRRLPYPSLPTEIPSNWQQTAHYPNIDTTRETHLFISGEGNCFLANETIDGWVIDNIISMAPNITLDGVIFDHRCNLNTTQLIAAMKKLKQAQLHVSYRVVTSDIYNNPSIKKTLNATLITAKDFYHHPSIKPALHDKMMADEHFYHKVNTTAQQTLNYPIPTIENFYYPPNREQRLYDKIISTKHFYHHLNNTARQALLDNLVAAGDCYPPPDTTEQQALIDSMLPARRSYHYPNTTEAVLIDKMITDEHFYNNLNTLAQQPLNSRIVTDQDRAARHYNARLTQRNKMVAGANFNKSFTSLAEEVLHDKIKAIIQSGHCDHFIHDYSDTAIWTREAINEQTTYALHRSILHGMPIKKIILALEMPAEQWKTQKCFEEINTYHLGGLLFWNPANITSTPPGNIQPLFQPISNHYANATQKRQEGNVTSALQQKINQAIPKMEKFVVLSIQKNISDTDRDYWTDRAQNMTLNIHKDGLFVITKK